MGVEVPSAGSTSPWCLPAWPASLVLRAGFLRPGGFPCLWLCLPAWQVLPRCGWPSHFAPGVLSCCSFSLVQPDVLCGEKAPCVPSLLWFVKCLWEGQGLALHLSCWVRPAAPTPQEPLPTPIACHWWDHQAASRTVLAVLVLSSGWAKHLSRCGPSMPPLRFSVTCGLPGPFLLPTPLVPPASPTALAPSQHVLAALGPGWACPFSEAS